MSENNNQDKKRSPFSIYWIYGLIGVSIIAFQLFMSGSSDIKLKYQSTFFALADSNYVTNVYVVNKN